MSDRLTNDLAALKIDRDDQPRRSPWKLLLILALVGGAVAAVAFVGYPALSSRVFKAQVELTEIALVSPAQSSIELTATGYVDALRRARVAAKTTGRISEFLVGEGDVVKKGQIIAKLDDANAKSTVATARARVAAVRARAAAARATLAETQQQLTREQALAAKGVTPQATVDDLAARKRSLVQTTAAADAEIAAAQAEVDSLELLLNDMQVTAPIDGTVIDKGGEVGDLVGPMLGQAGPLVALVDFTSLIVEIDVPESKLQLVKIGSPCEAVLDAFPGRRHRCATLEIGRKVDRAKASVKVKVKFLDPPENALPDMAARVSFLAKELDAAAMKEPPKLVVPKGAVIERDGQKVVYVVEEGKLRLTNVQVIDTFGDALVLKNGPVPGTKVVANPAADLRDGQNIKEKKD